MGCSVPLCKCPTALPWWVAGGWQHPQPPACSFTPSRWEKGQWLEISRVDFAIEMKKSSRWCFLMKPYLFPVSVGASLPAATSAPAIKAPFHPVPPRLQDVQARQTQHQMPPAPRFAQRSERCRRCCRTKQVSGEPSGLTPCLLLPPWCPPSLGRAGGVPKAPQVSVGLATEQTHS